MAKVESILGIENKTSKAGKNYTITKVLVEGKEAEALGTVNVGAEGYVTYNEQYRKNEFKPAVQALPARSNTKEFKADPVKNASIERQVALKAAVDVTVANLPLQEKVSNGKDQVKGVLTMAAAFDQWLKTGETPNPKVSKEGVVDTAKAILGAEEVPPHTDEDVPEEIDINDIPF